MRGGPAPDNLRGMKFSRVQMVAGLTVPAAMLILTACGPASSTAANAPSSKGSAGATVAASPSLSGQTGTSQPPAGGPATTAAPSSSTGTSGSGQAPTQLAAGGEFQTPSGNITCEMDQAQVYCQTASPARSVKMDATGKYTTCTGEQCLANAGEGTPTLAYGTATNEGPFRCMSAVAGLTCVADGKGFGISNGGITPATG